MSSHAARALARWDEVEAQGAKAKPEDVRDAVQAMAAVLRRQAVRPSADPLRAMPFSMEDLLLVCRRMEISSADVARLFPKVGIALEACIPQVEEALQADEQVAQANKEAEAEKSAADFMKELAAAGTDLDVRSQNMFDEATAQSVFDVGDP